MRAQQALGLAFVSAVAVVAADMAFKSSLLRTLWPSVRAPADGAITVPPVVVRWQGPQPLSVTLTGDGIREDLGMRESPLEIDARHFPRPGQYAVELHSPLVGRLVWSERRFLVRTAVAERAATDEPDSAPSDEIGELHQQVEKLQARQELSQAENATLYEENTLLRQQKEQLTSDLADAREGQDQTEAKLASLEAQYAELSRQHREILEAGRALQVRLESLPACVAWGYLSYPRPQMVPQTRRIVVASNGRGDVFRSQAQCEAVRRADPTAASPCNCLGTPWGG